MKKLLAWGVALSMPFWVASFVESAPPSSTITASHAGDVSGGTQTMQGKNTSNEITGSGTITVSLNTAKWLSSGCTGNVGVFNLLSGPQTRYVNFSWNTRRGERFYWRMDVSAPEGTYNVYLRGHNTFQVIRGATEDQIVVTNADVDVLLNNNASGSCAAAGDYTLTVSK